MAINGSTTETVRDATSGSRLDGIAIDPTSRLLYYTDMRKGEIGILSLDGRLQKTILPKVYNSRPIVLDPLNGRMFFATRSKALPTLAGIWRANMDGTNLKKIVSGGLRFPNGLIMDEAEQRLYWIDGETLRLESCKFDGSDRRLIRSISTGHAFGLAMKPNGTSLYYTDWNNRGIFEVPKNGTTKAQVYGNDVFSGLNELKYYRGSSGTTDGNALGAACRFPFLYGGVQQTHCITTDHHRPWCGTTYNYDLNRRWGNCDAKVQVSHTEGGNGGGAACVFPYVYNNNMFTECITDSHHREWCATTNNYDNDGLWGNCPFIGETACSTNNGGCSQLCIPAPEGQRVCACQGLTRTKPDNTSCYNEPTCPHIIPGGSLGGCNTTVNSKCNVSCNVHFKLTTAIGQNELVCRSAGDWYETTSNKKVDMNNLCIEQKCSQLVTPLGLFARDCTDLSYVQSSCELYCGQGYRMSWSNSQASRTDKVTCGSNLEWSRPEIQCSPVYCRPRSIFNGKLINCSYLANHSCDYECDAGYTKTISGHMYYCDTNGAWGPTTAHVVCQEITTTVITTPTTTAAKTTTTAVKTSVTVTTPQIVLASTELPVVKEKQQSNPSTTVSGLTAGLVVVTVLLVLLIVGLAFFLYRRRVTAGGALGAYKRDNLTESTPDIRQASETPRDASNSVAYNNTGDGNLAFDNPIYGETKGEVNANQPEPLATQGEVVLNGTTNI